jgi:hypothetical protein
MAALPPARFACHYRAKKFPAHVTTPGLLHFTADDLAHALFVTGRAPGDRLKYGQASYWEFIHRTSLIPAYIRMTSGGRLKRSRLAVELDRSEKVALSYALGQAMTSIFCEKLVHVSHLMHIDRYGQKYAMTFGATRKRADLFGVSPAGWVVAEAKGRSNSMERGLEHQLTSQKRSVLSVGGAPPALALGCVASFPPLTGVLRIDAFDPQDYESDPIALSVQDDQFYLAYYEPFIELLDFGDRDDNGTHTVTALDGSMRIGLDHEIEERVRGAMAGQESGLASFIREHVMVASQVKSAFPDGSVVQTDWQEMLSLDDWRG